ncbi:MAG: bifunctional UDP-3-O-[3-hydroxymyristoyl] N-acetylglucosamine deacetylase/3-hydroxyacyl-ACP dehydratase [Ichthyobacteriaceae bacterium]|nr:bifunctional UDP-3-O-[3-hydroxymyristoyl] N-acetylglucosamine deacetylase/3-hydroxyacyl-ACP dehydratase [Ichthyobacteriaceae bacterium]
MSQNQKTLKEEVSLSGVGLHTGKQVTITFKPAPTGHGFKFSRIDLEGKPIIEADANYVTNTQRGTVLEKKGVKVHTTEHALAALLALDLDNVLIEMDGPEPPIMDGSSIEFVKAVQSVGVEEQDAERVYYEITDIVSYVDSETGSEIIAMPAEEFSVTTMVDFGTKILGTQNATLHSLNDFVDEIANSRTFSFLHELESLIDSNLIKGGDLNNAIIYVDKEISTETLDKLKRIFNKKEVTVKPNGILDNLTLHHPNEAARHKLLDVVGDLALIGTRIKGKIIANKPGHFINTQFAKKLAKAIKLEKRNKVPKFDLNKEPLFGIEEIMRMLPHRPPFLLIDKILEMSASHIVGVKNVTMNEPFFVGHFPGAPVMPGVLQVEAMAQAGGLMILSTLPDPENYLTYFMKIDNVKFKQMVKPGDTLVFRMDLISPIRRGICHMQGYAYANNKLVMEAELMAQVAKKK